MKIGILTFPDATGYGAALQMYGLYRTVQENGVEAEVINYQNPYMKTRKHTSAIQKCSDMMGEIYQPCNKGTNVKYAPGPSLREWLNLVRHAVRVVINYFYDAAFLNCYRKKFCVDCFSKTSSRIEGLMESYGLQNRAVGEDVTFCDEHIDHAEAEARITLACNPSLDYLKQFIWK